MERLSQFNIRLYLSYLESFIQFILSTLGNIHTTITGIVIGCLLTTAFTLRKVLNIRNYLLQKSIFLELTPPAFTEKTGGVNSRNMRSEEHTSELQSHSDLVCRLLL